MTQNTITRAIMAAEHFTSWDEGLAIRDAILARFTSRKEAHTFLALFCYAAGIAEGKHRERQRFHARQQGERFTGSGDFLYTVEGDGAAPAFVAGDVVTIRAAACTPDLQTARAVVIRQGDRALIGRLVMYPDGRADLIHAGQLVPFDPERDFIGPVVAVWRALEPAAPAQE